ncbi:hypothetical protein [Ferrovibrio sp.]|uniref:tetratricopeptide repeat protein n=1 Tax=Ferrovibrio sp. TaxID=1917215 RepID=UPI001B4B82DD|nr:hypothetical protein [Ferrovibrio sp.]MBP7064275.1 hypothetical protein [Ferrovibrio sp.]
MTIVLRNLRRIVRFYRSLQHKYHLTRDSFSRLGCLLAARRKLLSAALRAALRQRSLTAALHVLEQDDDAAWLEFLGAACRRLGCPNHARRLLDRAVRQDPERVSAWCELAAAGVRQPPEALFPSIFVYHHLGLGDHIICQALVRHVAAEHGSVGLMVRRSYLDSVRFMYRDDPAVRFLVVRDDREAEAFLDFWPETRRIRIGHENLNISKVTFAESFYNQLGFDYARRWDGSIRRDPAREEAFYRRVITQPGPFIFVHEDPRRRFGIDLSRLPKGVPIIRSQLGLTPNIFDYGLVLERAAEIHTIDSSFRHIVDTLNLTGPRLFLHLYAKGVDVPARLPWTILT